MIHPIEGLEIDLEWPDEIDPADWRSQPDPDFYGDEAALEDDDEDLPTPGYVESMLGFDPDEFKEQR